MGTLEIVTRGAHSDNAQQIMNTQDLKKNELYQIEDKVLRYRGEEPGNQWTNFVFDVETATDGRAIVGSFYVLAESDMKHLEPVKQEK